MKLSPERHALALAIEAKVCADQEVKASASALDDFDEKRQVTNTEYYTAQNELEEAKGYLSEMLRNNGGNEEALALAAARYGEEHPRDRVRASEARFEEISGRRRLADEGELKFKTRVTLAREKQERALRKANEAAAIVERSDWLRLFKETKVMRDEVFKRNLVLRHLASSFSTIQHNNLDDPDLLSLRSYLRNDTQLPGLEYMPNFDPEMEREALAPWWAARAALLADASAPLPTSIRANS